MAYPVFLPLQNRDEVIFPELNPRTGSLTVTVMRFGVRIGVGTFTPDQFDAVEDVVNEWRENVERVRRREESQTAI